VKYAFVFRMEREDLYYFVIDVILEIPIEIAIEFGCFINFHQLDIVSIILSFILSVTISPFLTLIRTFEVYKNEFGLVNSVKYIFHSPVIMYVCAIS
jgi:hypothetical protein